MASNFCGLMHTFSGPSPQAICEPNPLDVASRSKARDRFRRPDSSECLNQFCLKRTFCRLQFVRDEMHVWRSSGFQLSDRRKCQITIFADQGCGGSHETLPRTARHLCESAKSIFATRKSHLDRSVFELLFQRDSRWRGKLQQMSLTHQLLRSVSSSRHSIVDPSSRGRSWNWHSAISFRTAIAVR